MRQFVPMLPMLPMLLLTASLGCGPRAQLGPSPRAATDFPAVAPIVPPLLDDVDDEDDAARTGVISLELEPLRIDVIVGPDGTEAVVSDARTLFDDGTDALVQGRPGEAILAYERLLADFPDSKLAGIARYNAGIAHERAGDDVRAAALFAEAIAAAPAGSSDEKDARQRLGDLLLRTQQFARAEASYLELLARTDLTPAERIAALAALGHARLEAGDYAAAEETLRSAIRYHEEASAAEHVDARHHLAMAQYFLAAIPQRQFAALPLRYPEEQMARDLDQKSQLFLVAQERYERASESGDLYYATGALFQVAAMYRKFWDDFMLVPIPRALDVAEAKEYVKGINEEPQIRILLQKALTIHERNIGVGREFGATPWVDRSVVAVGEIREFLARQTGGELFVPGSVPIAKAGRAVRGSGAEYLPARREL